MRPRHPVPLKHFDYLGFSRYSLRFCTHQRQTLFHSDEAVSLVLTQILRAACEQAFDVIAYCFMPDHVHLLVAGSASDSRLPQFSARAKQYSGFHFKARYGVRLWQRYAYERVLRSDESTVDVVRYILDNPIRKGMVSRPDDYPFTGSGLYGMRELMACVQSGRWESG